MSSEAGTYARWWIGRTITALAATRTGPQRPPSTATNLMIDAARSEGATWAEVGRALGITRQAARQAALRRHQLDQAHTEASQWHLPLPTRRPRFRWLRRRAA